MVTRPKSQTKTSVAMYEGDRVVRRNDSIVTEEPLEIRLRIAGDSKSVAITMRTPGSDFELAAGFLLAEGIVRERERIVGISYCKDDDLPEDQLYNIVIVEMVSGALPDLRALERRFYVSSACGVCGKASLEGIEIRGIGPVQSGLTVDPATIAELPGRLRSSQKLFDETGGLHAAGLFTHEGELVEAREDVGRHNAVDKVLGWAFLQGHVPLRDHVLMVSGRSSFEIAQKALAAGIPMVCSVSAPSSLAIDVAQRFGMTLVGFVRGDRFNVYAGAERISTGVER